MAGFQRFISYLYKYENDNRQENIGFAKVEIRGTSYRLEVHVRNLNLEKPDCTVYLFARNKEIMHGVPIGEMYIRRGNGDMRYAFEEKDLSEFGIKMEQVEGIFIQVSEGLYIDSQWKEGEIREKNLLMLKKGEMEDAFRPREEVVISEEKETVQTSEENITEDFREVMEETAEERKEAPKNVTDSVEQESIGEEKGSDEEKKGESGDQQDGEQGKENLKATEIPLEKFLEEGDLEGAFQKLRLKLTVFYPFQGENIECVKVDITDLQELPKKYWYLGKNSFLLHGFFNYRHLIIGEIKDEERCSYFVGVPGVFQNQERIMAAMFGFPEFRTAEHSEFKTGNFGYWYRVM